MKVGDRVQVTYREDVWFGLKGTIVEIIYLNGYGFYLIHFDNGLKLEYTDGEIQKL